MIKWKTRGGMLKISGFRAEPFPPTVSRLATFQGLFFALKGRDNPAQGNAWEYSRNTSAPERRARTGSSKRESVGCRSGNPGRCPCFSPQVSDETIAFLTPRG